MKDRHPIRFKMKTPDTHSSICPPRPRNLGRWPALALIAALNGIWVQPLAQPLGCDEGVIRLADRSGTIQICSSLAGRIPELAKQLTQATAQLGSQQAQIAELTRLVRGLNNVSHNIGLSRQAEMLQTLSAEIEKARREREGEVISRLNDRLDGLQASLLRGLSDPKTAAALGEALKGSVGEAISKLDLSDARKQIEDITERLKAIQSSVGIIQDDTAAIRQQLAQMERNQSVSGEAQQRLSQETLNEVRKIVDEFASLANKPAPIGEPKTFSEIYYSARMLAQKGETDASLRAFARLVTNPLPVADPFLDWTALLTRVYGRAGATAFLEKNFKSVMVANTYAYAQQLLSETATPDALAIVRQDTRAFPPLTFQVATRLLRLTQGSQAFEMPWSNLAYLSLLYNDLSSVAKSGGYTGYYVDQFRSIAEIDEISKGANSVKVLLTRDRVNIAETPVVLDFTYVRKPNTVEIKLWDDAVGRSAQVMLCGKTPDGRENCIDLNSPALSCSMRDREIRDPKAWFEAHKKEGSDRLDDQSQPNGCAGFRRDARYIGRVPPKFGGTINVVGLLTVPCIASLTYSTYSGRKMRFEATDLIAVTSTADTQASTRTLAQTCGYSYQGI